MGGCGCVVKYIIYVQVYIYIYIYRQGGQRLRYAWPICTNNIYIYMYISAGRSAITVCPADMYDGLCDGASVYWYRRSDGEKVLCQ